MSQCCPSRTVPAEEDYGLRIGIARYYLESRGVLFPVRGPLARTAPKAHRVHSFPLVAPLPLPELQHYLTGEPPPDNAGTPEWPHPQVPDVTA